MKEIYSQDNKIYKYIKSLEIRKHREKNGTYIIEGTNIVLEAIKNDIELECIVFRPDYPNPEDIINNLKIKNEPLVLAESLFNKLSQTENSQGVLAVAFQKKMEADDFFKFAGNKNLVILDRLQDPGNIGTIIRTADAAGYGGVITMKGTGDVFSPKVIRSATGSVFRMPVLCMDTPKEADRLCKKYGKKIVASCIDAKQYYYDVDLKENIALIIGNEGQGICEEFVEQADIKLKIPMSGNIDSLNAAVAAGILMYESVRK